MPNPTTGEPRNAERAARAKSALAWYNNHALKQAGDFDEDTLRDLLADLMHFCTGNPEFSFTGELEVAKRNYKIEVALEKAVLRRFLLPRKGDPRPVDITILIETQIADILAEKARMQDAQEASKRIIAAHKDRKQRLKVKATPFKSKTKK